MIVIGRLHIGAILPEWLAAWEQLQKPEHAVLAVTRQVVHCARNDIVRGMLANYPDATHLFFIDDDVTLPPDGLMRLLQDSIEHDIPIMTGLYIQRGEPHLPVVYRRHPNGRYVHLTQFCEGLQAIDGCGAGCLLIRRDVLEAIEATGQPWFDWDTGVSEDLAFCGRAQALGFTLALDFSVKCGHLSLVEVTYSAYEDLYRNGVQFGDEEIARLSTEVRPWPPVAVTEAAHEHVIQSHHTAKRRTRHPRRHAVTQ